MNRIFTEENGLYQIDCSKAVWATDELNSKEYVYILEYPHGDSVSRKMIRNRLKAKLPFALQENIGKQKLIEKVEVLSIAEWNADPQYGEFPIQPV